MTFNPFDPRVASAALGTAEAARQRRQQDTAAALGHPAGRAWLRELAEAERSRPSYVPGQDFATTAYHEGRKAVLAEIEAWLDAAPREGA